MNFKYLALGILMGGLAPYALTLIKAKKDNSASSEETIFSNDEDTEY